MKKLISLNESYAEFSTGELNRKNFEVLVYYFIKEKIQRPCSWDLDDYNDYLSWLYPRVCKAIDSYKETGSNFEAYISTLLKMSIKEYRSILIKDNLVKETASLLVQISNFYVSDNEPNYDEKEITIKKTIPKIRNKRQLLTLLLKCCMFVSNDFLERISPSLGMEQAELKSMIKQLQRMQIKKEVYMNDLREKINTQFFRCLYYEKKLRGMAKETIAAQRLKSLLERGRTRLNNMRARLAKSNTGPSNQQIAFILGISKGTVDANLYNLKKKAIDDQNKNT
ncbi:MAG: hypothetical protein FWH41_02390 [Treponema sp.]|nr:hypothetical protein [Treponema sp.]